MASIAVFIFRPRDNEDQKPTRLSKSKAAKTTSKTDSSKESKLPATAASKPKPTDSAIDVAAINTRKRVRFIRIELPRKGVLALAEVEAFADGRNVAPFGFATQKSTQKGGDAARAVDGNTSGKFSDKGQTLTEETDKPWWQLDLGGAYPVDKVVVHNGTDPGSGERQAGFTLLLADGNRRQVLEAKNQPAPNPRSEFLLGGAKPDAASQPNLPPAKQPEPKKDGAVSKAPAAKAADRNSKNKVLIYEN